MNTINASSLNIGQTTQSYQISGTAKNEQEDTEKVSASPKSTEQTLIDSDDSISQVSSQGDTLSISEEGLNASQNAALLAANDTASTTSSSSTTKDLSSYSDSQLKTMLNNGEITQSEYNKEIASRQLQNATTNFDISELEEEA